MNRTLGEHNDWVKFDHLFIRQEVPARTILLREGEVSRHAHVIERGCLRTWFNHDGKDITTQFFFENDRVASIESFKTDQPGLLTIESIEPSILRTISKENFQFILEQSPSIKLEFEEHIFRRFVYCQKQLLSHIKDTPQQRYEDIVRHRPDIVLRVPQHYIASYLGITKVHLSRIKAKIAREHAHARRVAG